MKFICDSAALRAILNRRSGCSSVLSHERLHFRHGRHGGLSSGSGHGYRRDRGGERRTCVWRLTMHESDSEGTIESVASCGGIDCRHDEGRDRGSTNALLDKVDAAGTLFENYATTS